MIIKRQITWKWYNILYLQWPINRKSYMIYWAALFSMTLNDPYPQFQGHAILWRWISKKTVRHTDVWCYWNTNGDFHTPYATVSFRMTLRGLEWLSKIFNDTKRRASPCDSWASCICKETCECLSDNLYLLVKFRHESEQNVRLNVSWTRLRLRVDCC